MKYKNDPFAGIDYVKDMSQQDKDELLKEAYSTLEVEEVEPSMFIICGSDITSFILFSFLIKSFYTSLHLFICKEIIIVESIKIIIYALTGVFLAFICTCTKKSKRIQKFLFFIYNKSINDNVFNDLIDFKKPTNIKIYLKSSDYFYKGKFCYLEEKGLDSWIVLKNYIKSNKSVNSDPEEIVNSAVVINLRNIDNMEFYYENGSDVWEKMNMR